MFSIVYGAMMKGLPYSDGDKIVVVIGRANVTRGVENQPPSIQDYFNYKAERFDGSWITANTFDTLGVRPALGRDFRAGEDTPYGEKVAILAYSTWREIFAGVAALLTFVGLLACLVPARRATRIDSLVALRSD